MKSVLFMVIKSCCCEYVVTTDKCVEGEHLGSELWSCPVGRLQKIRALAVQQIAEPRALEVLVVQLAAERLAKIWLHVQHQHPWYRRRRQLASAVAPCIALCFSCGNSRPYLQPHWCQTRKHGAGHVHTYSRCHCTTKASLSWACALSARWWNVSHGPSRACSLSCRWPSQWI